MWGVLFAGSSFCNSPATLALFGRYSGEGTCGQFPNHVEVATVSGLASVSKAYVCGGCFAGTGTGAGAASLARSSKQKSRHQAAFLSSGDGRTTFCLKSEIV